MTATDTDIVPTEEEVIETPEVEVEVEEPSAADKEIEAAARRMGWRPKDEYAGNPSRWVDANTFIERGERELPILRERFRKQDSILAKNEKDLTEANTKITEMSKVLTELTDMSRSAHKRGYDQAMGELKVREERAVSEANVEEYRRIQIEKERLEPARPAPVVDTKKDDVPPPPPAADPIIQRWLGENSWFNSDRVLNAFALDADMVIQRQYPQWSLEDKLAEVKKQTMEKFPEKFGITRREPAARVATTSAPAPKPKGKTVKDLPPDAKDALERFKRQIPNFKDEDYLKTYDWS